MADTLKLPRPQIADQVAEIQAGATAAPPANLVRRDPASPATYGDVLEIRELIGSLAGAMETLAANLGTLESDVAKVTDLADPERLAEIAAQINLPAPLLGMLGNMLTSTTGR